MDRLNIRSNDNKKVQLDDIIVDAIGSISMSIIIGELLFLSIYINYLAFSGISFLTFNFMLYEWISLFTKSPIHMIISIFSNFSDFGIFFVLFLLLYYCICDYIPMVKNSFSLFKDCIDEYFIKKIKNIVDNRSEYYCNDLSVLIVGSTIFISAAALVIIILNLLIKFFTFYVIIYMECFILLSMSIKVNKNMIKSHKKSKPDINFNDMRKRRNKVQILGRYDYLEKEKFEFPRLNEMLYQSRKTQIFCKNNIINRIIIIIILFGLQLYSIIMPFAEGSISIFEFIIFLTVKMIFCEKILAFNLIDIVLNRKKVMKLMKKKNVRVIFWITLTCYIFLFISFIIIFCITRRSIYATVDRSRFYENEGTWYKYDENFTMNPEPFCYGKSINDGTLQTADFAMMTTLPRLYGINEEGRCYIKPSKRGLFNSTMKYIFGREYEKDNIRIFCKKIFHDPVLIITSDKILESMIKHFSATNITKIEAQFNITNKNYFNEQRIEKIKNEEVRALYDKYAECINKQGEDKCRLEWEFFNEVYWIKEHSDDYEPIEGFERYQIQLDESMTIQPSFITDKGKYIGSTHYIVGGSYEDRFGIGLFIETICKKYIPLMLENILPFYSFIRHFKEDHFIGIERFNRHIFYFDFSSTKIISSLENLLAQFNFTESSLFFVGHSISGAAFKEFSYINDIQGITFETPDVENNHHLYKGRTSVKQSEFESKIMNIYSDGMYFKSKAKIKNKDKNSFKDGILPKGRPISNVYETACMTSIVCSETRKYVPHCKQILAQDNKNNSNAFNHSIESYLQHYGYY